MAAPLRLSSPVVVTDRRDGFRHPVTVMGELSCAGDGPQPVSMTDISDRGCRIVRPAGLDGDTVVSLSFGGYAPFRGRVAWTLAEEAGLRFDQPLHPALVAQVLAAAKGRRRTAGGMGALVVRREDRERLWYLRRPVVVSVGEGAWRGVLCDLSSGGCRIELADAPAADMAVSVTLEGRHPLTGDVRWARDGAIGVMFTTALLPEVVRAIAEEG